MAGVVAYGHAKDYVVPKFEEMSQACILPHADVVIATERTDVPITCSDVVPMPYGIKGWVEDIIMDGRDKLRLYALSHGYDAYVHQGIDCLYRTSKDFERLVSHNVDVVGALTAGRNDSSIPVARRFVLDDGGKPTEEQERIPDKELLDGGLVRAGYPGADALVVKGNALLYGYENHMKWYDRVSRGMANLECEEELLLNLTRAGYGIWLDTKVKTWHVHEDLVARMWPNEEKFVFDLHWR